MRHSNVTYLRYILIKRFGYELIIKISDEDTCVMRGTATSSCTRQNEEGKFSFRKSTAVWRVMSCVLTQCPLYGVPHHCTCYGMSSLMKDFSAKRMSCSQTRQKAKLLTDKMNLKSENISL